MKGLGGMNFLFCVSCLFPTSSPPTYRTTPIHPSGSAHIHTSNIFDFYTYQRRSTNIQHGRAVNQQAKGTTSTTSTARPQHQRKESGPSTTIDVGRAFTSMRVGQEDAWFDQAGGCNDLLMFLSCFSHRWVHEHIRPHRIGHGAYREHGDTVRGHEAQKVLGVKTARLGQAWTFLVPGILAGGSTAFGLL